MVDVEEMMSQEEVGEDKEVINIDDGDTREENEDGDVEDDFEMSENLFAGRKELELIELLKCTR